MDEASFLINHYITKSWHKIGSRPIKPYSYDKNKTVRVFGAISEDSSITHIADSLNSQNFIIFLEKILTKHEKVLLIMDNVQMHFSKLMLPFYQKYPEIQILRTPKYSPQFNPIEIYWRNVKDWVGLSIILNINKLEEVVRLGLEKDFLIPKISESIVA